MDKHNIHELDKNKFYVQLLQNEHDDPYFLLKHPDDIENNFFTRRLRVRHFKSFEAIINVLFDIGVVEVKLYFHTKVPY
jgi:hypothetical protein